MFGGEGGGEGGVLRGACEGEVEGMEGTVGYVKLAGQSRGKAL